MRNSVVAAVLATASSILAGPLQSPEVSGAAGAQTVSLDLAGALARARNYSLQLVQTETAAALAREDRLQARAAFYPTLNALNQYIYTQGNGTPSGIYVANDGVHVYNEQALAHAEIFSPAKRAEYRRAVAAEAAAAGRSEIAARGLVSAVVQNYYALVAAQRRESNARRGVEEARAFLEITRKQERGGEVAHADVIKAELQYQQKERDSIEATTNTGKARIALGALLFADVSQPYSVVDDLKAESPLPSFDDVQTKALASSPDVRAAGAALNQAGYGVSSARAAYYPSFAVDYFYGINANVLGVRGPDGRKNLGSVVQGTVAIPVWNWGLTRSRVRQAELLRQQAQYELAYARRLVLSGLHASYMEAQTARAQLGSLNASLDLATESLRLTLLRYQAGEASALEVTDAQNTLVQARNAYDDGLARYRVAVLNVEILAGTFRP